MGVSDSGGVGDRDEGGVGVEYMPPEDDGCTGELPGEQKLGFIRFSFWRRLQNHTRTTSRSIIRPSEINWISSLVGLGLALNAFSNAILIVLSMEVRFLRRRARAS